MKIFAYISIFGLMVHSAVFQIQRGTVGVIHFTEDKISIAADSRGILSGSNAPPDDTICKIAALGGDVVFVSAGASSYPGDGTALVPPWSNLEEARTAYNTVKSAYFTVRGHVGDVATVWGNNISSAFDRLAVWHPDKFRSAISPVGGLTDAIIGGFDANGILVLFLVRILPPPSLSGTGTQPRVQQITCPHNFCVIGAPEIVDEFSTATTERAQSEEAIWVAGQGYIPGDYGYDMLHTMRMVELTMMYHIGNDVGGPVDAVQLRRSDGSERVHWYARKQNCRAN